MCSKMDSALGGTGDALKGVTGGIKTFAKALDGSYNSVYQWVVLIGVGIAVLSLMLYLILAIGEGTEKAGQIILAMQKEHNLQARDGDWLASKDPSYCI